MGLKKSIEILWLWVPLTAGPLGVGANAALLPALGILLYYDDLVDPSCLVEGVLRQGERHLEGPREAVIGHII